ncbi:zinc finger protein OZF-like [Anastrepha ludens]|uniref:zinc finger protein OZF-like n=1 Tax=Anastrepha ludens TaxID=28586 RepID=UPI0023B021B6|nr:zinc finger protein OZF-like [Anastrepha ludens]
MEILRLQKTEMCTTDTAIKEWERWCRLCAKHDGCYFDIFLEQSPQSLDSDVNLHSIIEEFFHIKIKPRDGLPISLCTECCSAIASLEKYAEHIKKVQKMYKDLKNTAEFADINLKDLYQKYGLFKCETNLPQSTTSAIEQIFVSDIPNTVVKVEEMELTESKEVKNETEIDVDFHDPFANNNQNLEESTHISENSESSSSKSDSDEFVQQKLGYNKNVNEDKEGGSYSCNICQLSFIQRRNYMYHMKTKHSTEVPFWNCSHCSSSFKYKKELERHTRKIHAPSVYPCPHCERKFKSSKVAENHIKAEHERTRSLICEECGESVRTKQKLFEHMALHAGHGAYECEKCGKQYLRKQSLKRHLEIHGDKHICGECLLEFSTSNALKNHMKVHSDEMPYKCNYCGRRFKRTKNLKNHLITHTGLKPYSCDFCDKTFSTGSSCRYHKKHLHPKELAEQEVAGAKSYTKNIPTLNVLKAITQVAGKIEKDDGYIGDKRIKVPKLDAELPDG